MQQGEADQVLGRQLRVEQWDQLASYVELLAKTNSRVNLTSVRDREGIYRRHILESLALFRLLEERHLVIAGSRCIDVGSGGGIPGLPLAIVHPDVSVALLEATGKKAAFLDQAAIALRLDNVTVWAMRAEEAGQHAGYRESAMLVTARAVASLDTLAELTLPLAGVGGVVAAVKGSRVDEELEAAGAAIAACGGVVEAVVPLPLSEEELLRAVLLRKREETPARYPRRSGMPAKRPIR